ncbi:hypothetical protein [Parasedimentitalea maritima]|uniref:Uncharacterized protein n=1 Tax=Parasedimentitalea maritima TaxID=2578117 RepID=A0A6A4R849_9RHOB|nr:hypothetical protein [Zongyanglinia marina]KAE9627933.1 hypothetical protein GP644_17725 [Zongyanglinia marina]
MLRSCMKAAASSRKCRASEVGKSKVGVVRVAVIPSLEMLRDARMSGMTGRTAAADQLVKVRYVP